MHAGRPTPDGSDGSTSGELDFAAAFDLYQQVIYDVDAIADGVAKLIAEAGAMRILDCAAGSGVPALELRRRGLEVICSDGSAEMVAQFRRNAVAYGVDESCDVVDWADLDPDRGRYDYLMCRGNSLVYATSWGGGSDVAAMEKIRRYLISFRDMLRPGGWLHIDAPVTMSSPPLDKKVTERSDATQSIRVTEQVDDTAGSRAWTCTVSVQPAGGGGEARSLTFDLHSSRLTADALIALLFEVGFVDCGVTAIDGDRPCHATIIARTPDQPATISDQ